MENKNLFEVGLDVWSVAYGWGKVQIIERGEIADYYPVEVLYKNSEVAYYTLDGREMEGENRTLFFEEIAIPASALERPRKSALQMLEECEGKEFEFDKTNYFLIADYNTGKMVVRIGKASFVNRLGTKCISEEDAKHIVKECKENNMEVKNENN